MINVQKRRQKAISYHIYCTFIRLSNIYVNIMQSGEIPWSLVYMHDSGKSTLGWDPHAHKLLHSRSPGSINRHCVCAMLLFEEWWRWDIAISCSKHSSNTKLCSIHCATTAKEKRNSVQEYTDWGIVPMKGQVIIYFLLVFKFHQPKSHLPRELSHFKKNSQESIKQYQEEKEVR